MKRLFVAIPVSEEVKAKIKPLLKELDETGADLKLVSIENLHLTLKFLGEVDEEKIPKIIKELSAIKINEFLVSLQGVGVFPSLEKINVVWVGIESAELIHLIKKVNQTLNCVRKEEHEERPHLTISRVKSGKNKEQLQKAAEKYKTASFGKMMVDKIVLFESELRKEGPKYKIIKEFTPPVTGKVYNEE